MPINIWIFHWGIRAYQSKYFKRVEKTFLNFYHHLKTNIFYFSVLQCPYLSLDLQAGDNLMEKPDKMTGETYLVQMVDEGLLNGLMGVKMRGIILNLHMLTHLNTFRVFFCHVRQPSPPPLSKHQLSEYLLEESCTSPQQSSTNL